MVLPLPKTIPFTSSLQNYELYRLHPQNQLADGRTGERIYLEGHFLTLRYICYDQGHIFVSLFLMFDNASVVMMLLDNPSYRIVRRISYSVFLIGIIWQIMSFIIKLRESFKHESDLKKQLEEMTPV